MDSNQEPTLVEKILALGTRTFNPEEVTADGDRNQHYRAFTSLIARTPTLVLIPALNKLISPGRERVPPWLHCELMSILSMVPLRSDGVRATMEFVFTVHPDSTVTREEAATVQKRGAFITPQALKLAANVISLPPKSVDPTTWFEGIAPQLFPLLDGSEGPELVKAAGHIIGVGILGRREYGALGMPGFNVFVHPMLAKINPSLLNPNRNTRPVIKTVTEEVVDLRKNTAVVTADELVLALKRLHNLIHAYGHPAFARRLLPPVIWSLWSLASWIGASEHCEKNYCSPARDLVRIYVRLHASPLETRSLIRNLLFMGNKNPAKLQWKFKPSNDGQQIFISKTQENGPTNPLSNTGALLDLEPKASLLANILDEASTGDEISILFLDLFKQWVDAGRKKSTCEIVIKQDQDQDPDPLTRLLETKVLQELIKKTPKKLIGHPDQILDLIKEILQEQGSLPESDGPVATALSLLSIVVTSEGFQKSKVDKNTMDSIITSLGHICQTNSDVAKTAGNLSYLLQHWRDIEAQLQPMPTANARELEDRKTYNLALQYITGPDAPAPVRSEGLNMISNLIAGRSPILDIPATMALLSSLLEDRDDFINLRVIKMFNQLATHHPSSTVQELLDHYMDAQEQVNVDSRLRFGEALTQVVERLGETFTEELSKKTCQVLLLIAGRRAKREKTEKRQQKEARLSEMKRKKEAEAWGGTPPDWNGDEDKDVTSAEKQRSKIIASIVGGWESKRGSEDIRIRASALSILGAGMETNLDGVGPDMVTATIDLAMDILTMEPEVEKGILRRSAVLAVMSFIRALDKAKKSRRRIGFDLTDESQASISRTLEYIAHNDNDGLVQQHSRDVIESLQAWKMATLIPELPQQTQKGIFTRLAGLTVNPTKRLTPSMNPGSRPLVEEVE